MKKLLLLSILIIMICYCNTEDDNIDLNNVTYVKNTTGLFAYKNSDCLKSTKNKKKSISHLDFKINNNIIKIIHRNAQFNCCIKQIKVSSIINKNNINIFEKEILEDSGCKCKCSYNVSSFFSNITKGDYNIKIFTIRSSHTNIILQTNIRYK